MDDCQSTVWKFSENTESYFVAFWKIVQELGEGFRGGISGLFLANALIAKIRLPLLKRRDYCV